MDEMETIIRKHGPYAYGNEKIEDVAQEWADEGFTPAQADSWLEAGCFRASDARELADCDVSPDQASQKTTDGVGKYESSYAYKFANNDMSLQDVLEALGKN